MTDTRKPWRSFEAEGTRWEVRIVSEEGEGSAGGAEDHEIIEFSTADGLKPARRLAVPAGSLGDLDEAALRAAFRKARPIGGDYYGRPGKRMPDMNS
ncbi:MAG: hypothetical protein ACRELV_06170 [Longimicrobiales bacterium]